MDKINKLTLNDVFNFDEKTVSQNLFDAYLLKSINTTNVSYYYIDWISKHPLLTLQIIYNNPQLKWNMAIVSANIAIPFSQIILCKKLKWNWDVLSIRDDLTSKIVEDNIDLKWNYNYIALTSILTCKMIMEVPYLKQFSQINKLTDLNYENFNSSKESFFE